MGAQKRLEDTRTFALPWRGTTVAMIATIFLHVVVCKAAETAVTRSELASIISEYDGLQRQLHPDVAAEDGDRESLGRLEDDSPPVLAKERMQLEAIASRLHALPPSAGMSEDEANEEYLSFVVDRRLADLSLDVARMNFDAYSGFHLLHQDSR